MLNAAQAIEQVQILKESHNAERTQLDLIRRYWKGRQALPAVIPPTAPREVRTMARIARVNVCPIVVDSLTQSMFVDGFRNVKTDTDADVWQVWQANKMDAHQTAIHRAAFAYGTAYAVVLPGDSAPVIRAASPRSMHAVYGEDPDWPIWALERLGGGMWKLFDDQFVYYVSEKATVVNGQEKVAWSFIDSREHAAGVVPVVRYLDEDDLDAEDDVDAAGGLGDLTGGWDTVPGRGQIGPLMAIQDQIDLTTFGLLVAQWYAAFRQRYIIGWVPDDEAQKMKAGASQLWTFQGADDDGEGGKVQVGEFGQTDLSGYIESREASLRHAATLSQTPVHELLGELVNLSAEALAAAEQGHERKVGERQTLIGEAHEQMLRLVGTYTNQEIPQDAEVIWRDTSAKNFSATVNALGMLVTTLGVPAEELWERVPGVTQQDVERWKAAAESGNAFEKLTALLERQNQPPPPPPPAVD